MAIGQSAIATVAGTSTPAVSFATLPTAGSTVLLILATWKGSTHTHNSVADNQGNSYTQVGATVNGDAGADYIRLSMWRAENIGTPSGTFTVTLTASSTVDGRPVVVELTGMAASSVLDQQVAGGPTTNASPTATLATTTNAADVIIGAVSWHVGGAVTITENATNLPTLIKENEDNSTNQCINVSGRVVTSVGAYTGNWALSGSRIWICLNAAFKEGGAAAKAPPPFNPTVRLLPLLVR